MIHRIKVVFISRGANQAWHETEQENPDKYKLPFYSQKWIRQRSKASVIFHMDSIQHKHVFDNCYKELKEL